MSKAAFTLHRITFDPMQKRFFSLAFTLAGFCIVPNSGTDKHVHGNCGDRLIDGLINR